MKEQVIRATLKDVDSSVVDEILKDLSKDKEKEEGLETEVKTIQPSTTGNAV